MVARRPGDLYVHEYRHGSRPEERIWAVWSPTGDGKQAEKALPIDRGRITRAERMPLTPAGPEPVPLAAGKPGTVRLPVDGSPVFLRLRAS